MTALQSEQKMEKVWGNHSLGFLQAEYARAKKYHEESKGRKLADEIVSYQAELERISEAEQSVSTAEADYERVANKVAETRIVLTKSDVNLFIQAITNLSLIKRSRERELKIIQDRNKKTENWPIEKQALKDRITERKVQISKLKKGYGWANYQTKFCEVFCSIRLSNTDLVSTLREKYKDQYEKYLVHRDWQIREWVKTNEVVRYSVMPIRYIVDEQGEYRGAVFFRTLEAEPTPIDPILSIRIDKAAQILWLTGDELETSMRVRELTGAFKANAEFGGGSVIKVRMTQTGAEFEPLSHVPTAVTEEIL